MRMYTWNFLLVLFSFLAGPVTAAVHYPWYSLDRVYDVFYGSSVFFDFWEEAKKLGDNATRFANEELQSIASKDISVAGPIHEFNAAWTQVVTDAGKILPTENSASTSHFLGTEWFDMEGFATFFNESMDRIAEELQAELELPLPEDQSERYRRREIVINKMLNMTEDLIASEEEIRQKFGHIKPHIAHAILVMGNLGEKHPYIVEALAFGVTVIILPESIILRPIARIFGISPLGPVKGSPAAIAQKFFFGHIIPRYSWFSRLQKAGMKRGILDTIRTIISQSIRIGDEYPKNYSP
ncbi:hypothetical protein BDN70DRAFT_893246 [Pholiota conissans]|uniref:Uncharacterized protein n=1 Tax=Pholiota conissans TaxID=109636 RepID=A0A9P5Z8U5_9AGAR|nr:hypothetical protein BDN70DRAFT_893246 [Pholiota conissans]